jgi:hypothetical protein
MPGMDEAVCFAWFQGCSNMVTGRLYIKTVNNNLKFFWEPEMIGQDSLNALL